MPPPSFSLSHWRQMGPTILTWLLLAARLVAGQSDNSFLTLTKSSTSTSTTTTTSTYVSTSSIPTTTSLSTSPSTSSTPTSQASPVATETGPLTLPISEYSFSPFPTPSVPAAPPSVFPTTDPLSPPLVSCDPQVVPDFAPAWAAAYDKAENMVCTNSTFCPI